jgi:MFS family permease
VPAPITLIVIVTTLAQASVFAVRPMVSYRALELGAGPFELGVVGGAFSLLSLFFGVPAGRWVDRRGERVAITSGAATIAIACAALMVANSITALAACHAVLGVASIVNIVGLQAIVANRASVAQRDRRFATFTMAVSFGQMLGPAAAGLIVTAVEDRGNWDGNTAVFLAGAASAVAATVLAVWLPRRPFATSSPADGADPGRPRVITVMRQPGMTRAMLVSVTVVTATDVFTTYMPAVGETLGLSVGSVTFLLALRAGASFLSRMGLPWLIDHVGRRRLLIFSTVIPALLLFPLPWLSHVATMAVLVSIIGFGLGIGQPMTMVWVANRSPEASRGIALGIRLSANRLGQITVPLAVGAVAGLAGIGSIFVSMAALLGVSAAAIRGADFDQDTEQDPTAHEP